MHGRSWTVHAIESSQEKWVYEYWVLPAVVLRLTKLHSRMKDVTRLMGHSPKRIWRVLDEG